MTELEIDERTRELRVHQRVSTPQPRVFDLIAYLSRHRDRVVSKDELLEQLWPGVVVTDASLQRAVSLARSACAELGVEKAIRTYARQGYRFSSTETQGKKGVSSPREASCVPSSALLEARAAYAAADWARALAKFQAVDQTEGLSLDDLRRWAHAAQGAGQMPDVGRPLEDAVAAYTARSDPLRAGWIAVLLSQLNFETQNALAAKGWLHRASRLLEAFPDSREQGYLLYLQARLGLASDEFAASLPAARTAHELGRRHGDSDLEYLGLLFTGILTLSLGQIAPGLALLDEAGVAVRPNRLSALAGSVIYCGVISVCMNRADWERAAHWTRRFQGWCTEHGPHAVPGLCRLHQAEVLNVRGSLAEAQCEAERARTVLAIHSHYAEGDAWRVVGEIQLGKGNPDAAEAAFLRAQEHGWNTQPGLALLALERGRPAEALRSILRGLDENNWCARQRRGLLLAHAIIIASRAHDPAQARKSLAELESNPALWSTTALRALVTCARGELAAAENKVPEAIAQLRAAIQQWQAIESPLPAARARCRLADLLTVDGEIIAAKTELTLAANAFERAGAQSLLRRCHDALGRVGSPATPDLRKSPI